MVKDAVDDMYMGCTEAMEEKIKYRYLKELEEKDLNVVWQKTRGCLGKKGDTALTSYHIRTICLYTSDYSYKNEKFYKVFNDAVRQGRSRYGSSFPFHTLHYWLTRAVQILNKNQCYRVYRRTSMKFTGKINQIIRFGFFTSTSFRKDLTNFWLL